MSYINNLFICYFKIGRGSVCEAAKQCTLQLNLAFKTCSCDRHHKNFVRNEDNLKCLKHMQNKLQLAYLPRTLIAAAAGFFLWHFPQLQFYY